MGILRNGYMLFDAQKSGGLFSASCRFFRSQYRSSQFGSRFSMRILKDAIGKAAHDTAAYVTADLRHSAIEHGWSDDVVSSMRVEHGEDGFKVMVPDHLKDKAFVHEFGDENSAPTAVIRKYSNNHEVAAHVMLRNIEKHLGGAL